MNNQQQRGPFHVMTLKHGHEAMVKCITYNTVEDLIIGIKLFLSNELGYEFCDVDRDSFLLNEMDDLDDIFAEKNVNIDQLIPIMI